jgi:hypothetical protein
MLQVHCSPFLKLALPCNCYTSKINFNKWKFKWLSGAHTVTHKDVSVKHCDLLVSDNFHHIFLNTSQLEFKQLQ